MKRLLNNLSTSVIFSKFSCEPQITTLLLTVESKYITVSGVHFLGEEYSVIVCVVQCFSVCCTELWCVL